EAARGGEFAFLAGSLNRMLSRLEELTAGLESRVRQATRDLAEKNRELQQANQRLWQAQLEIGRSGRLAALGQMAATIAHELGTPLNSVLGYTQLLRRQPWSADDGEKLAIIESQVQRMIETIRSVLDRTRDRELHHAPVSLGPLVAEALTIVSSRLAGREVALQSLVPPDLPPVPADAAALRQVLLNLLTNAIDATEPPGTITVSAVVLPQNGRPGRTLELTVSDTGHGMAPEELRRDGATVVWATDPRRALARAAEQPIDLAVLDVRMPELDGLELLRRLRERWPQVPVVIMTAFGSIDTAVLAIASGAVDYVSKPMDVEELRATVRRALGRRTETQAELPEAGEEFGGVVGRTPAMV